MRDYLCAAVGRRGQQRERAVAKNRVFISYKHEDPWVAMAEKFRIKLDNYHEQLDLEYFIDTEMLPGDVWRDGVGQALKGCTHFLCLLCDTYWQSKECRAEMDAVVARRAAGEPVRLLFVLCEKMSPGLLRFSADGTPGGEVTTVGAFHFLGPYDSVRRRIDLNGLAPGKWGDYIETMVSRDLRSVLNR
jgi:hypothetical protein